MKAELFSMTMQEFMSSFKTGDIVSVGALDSTIYLQKSKVIMEPERHGDMPKMLIQTVGKDEELPFSIHLSPDGNLFTDDTKVICNLNDTDLCITIEREESC